MLTIKEIFDICKEHDVFVDLSYLDSYYGSLCYMIKLYYGVKRHYALLDPSELEFIFASRESFEKYICNVLEVINKKEKEGEKMESLLEKSKEEKE